MKIVKSSDAPKGTNISNTSNKVILIQGAMDIEVEYLISKLNNIEKRIISEYEFWTGNIGSNKIIISKTRIGTLNATISTTIGIINFHKSGNCWCSQSRFAHRRYCYWGKMLQY